MCLSSVCVTSVTVAYARVLVCKLNIILESVKQTTRTGVMLPKPNRHYMWLLAPDLFYLYRSALWKTCQSFITQEMWLYAKWSIVNSILGLVAGKSYTMIGNDDSMQSLGIIPCAISWLFKLINECKEKTGARFSVRVSAVEVWGKDENLKDLLSEVATGSLQDGQSPGVYLCEDPICGMQVK